MKRNDFRLNTYFFTTVMTTIGCFLYACGINLFFVPHQFISGGFTGIAMILYYLTGFPIGISNMALNIPILFLALRHMGRFYTVITIIGTAICSLLIDVTGAMSSWEVVKNPILAAISGGVLIGTGSGILYRYNSNSGGLDVVGAVVKKYYSLEIGYVVFALNCLIVAISGGFFSVETAINTLVAMYISANVSSRIVIGFAQRKAAFIVSERPNEIADAILRRIHHGATLLYGQGAFTGDDKHIVFAILDLTQISKLKWIVRDIDPHAFLFIMNTTDVVGRGFTSPLSTAANAPASLRYHADSKGELVCSDDWQQELADERSATPFLEKEHKK